MTDYLKPCPFCGREPRVQEYTNGRKAVVCGNYDCPCFMNGNSFENEAEAIAAWNTRTYFGYSLDEETVSKLIDAYIKSTERTCHLSEKNDICSSCGACIQRITHSVYEMGDGYACRPRYCPNCGARVIGADE